MSNKLYILGIVSVVSVLLFSGCANQEKINNKTVTKQNSEPKWLDDPYIDGDKTAAVGCARIHFKGVTAQRKLAVSNAIDEIATQVNTTVKNVTLRQKDINNGKSSLRTQASSLQSVENVKLNTKVKAYYTKPNGEICTWVIQK